MMSEFERETMFAALCQSVGVNFTYASGVAMRMDEVIELLHNMGFFTQPASTRFHGNYEGGLFDHSYRVATELLKLTDALHLEWWRKGSMTCVRWTIISETQVVNLVENSSMMTGLLCGAPGTALRVSQSQAPLFS